MFKKKADALSSGFSAENTNTTCFKIQVNDSLVF